MMKRAVLVDALTRAVDLLERMAAAGEADLGEDAVCDSEYDDCLALCRSILAAEVKCARVGRVMDPAPETHTPRLSVPAAAACGLFLLTGVRP